MIKQMNTSDIPTHTLHTSPHTPFAFFLDGNNNASWAAHLRAVDYKLLCRNTGAADVVDYNTCHLARVPAHKVFSVLLILLVLMFALLLYSFVFLLFVMNVLP